MVIMLIRFVRNAERYHNPPNNAVIGFILRLF